jgi:alpha-amylase/alpha-mannosidase (GH57 family)
MTPIKLCLLWHQHQPYYRAGNRFAMPWAWLHATKDYLEMAEHLERHPNMRATINLVPSLLKQLEEYISGEIVDPVVELMVKPAAELTQKEKSFMLDNFFLANKERVIDRSPRFRELFEKSKANRAGFEEQDYLDLAVHYSLAWTGEIARMRAPFTALVEKERNYTEVDKRQLAAAQMQNVKRILALHRKLASRGQVELTTTPFYHPILPLLIDSESAREATPNMPLPHNVFRAPEEAERQLRDGRSYFESKLGINPRGLWPSEGSVSTEALGLIRNAGFEWTATDEAILSATIGAGAVTVADQAIDSVHAKYFPWKMETPKGELMLFFRDHRFSDDIGFTYQSWSAEDAVEHFIANILEVRRTLVEQYGEAILNHACISIILDGENCWEYYYRNGFEFLDLLYSTLTKTPEIKTATFSEVINSSDREALPSLKHIVAGSWINANFRIWIGHEEDNAAWDMLAGAKKVLDRERKRAEQQKGSARITALGKVEAAQEELMMAEGSDWCWWYGDDHYSSQKNIFDELFRMHVRAVYVKLGLTVPEYLMRPITSALAQNVHQSQFGAMHRFEEKAVPAEQSVVSAA